MSHTRESSREVSFASQERKLRDVVFVACLTRESSREVSFGSQERKFRDVAFLACITQGEMSREVSVPSQKRSRDVCHVFHVSNMRALCLCDEERSDISFATCCAGSNAVAASGLHVLA